MKQIYLLLTFFIGFSANAQITLTNTFIPQIGDNYDYVADDNISFTAGPSGANQTWDFSNFTGSTSTVSYISPSNASIPSTFPNATLVATSGGHETYFSSNTSGLYYEGHNSPGMVIVTYQNTKRTMHSFPMTFGDTYSGTFSGTSNVLFAGMSYDRTGTTQITADGYGTLILPYGTFNNVLRIKTVTVTSDWYMGMNLGTSYDSVYTWYDNANRTYLAGHAYINVSGQIGTQFTYLAQNSVVTSNHELLSERKELNIYPNPASEIVTIQGANANDQIDIYDASGKLVQTERVSAFEQQINISRLKPGMYMLRGRSGDAIFTEKLIVQ